MGLMDIFSTKSVDSVVDAVISTGDKLMYTDEEKADMKLKIGEMHIAKLKAYEKVVEEQSTRICIGNSGNCLLFCVQFFSF